MSRREDKFAVSLSQAWSRVVVKRVEPAGPFEPAGRCEAYYMAPDQADLLLRLRRWGADARAVGSQPFSISAADRDSFDSLLGRRFVRLTSDAPTWPERRADALLSGCWVLTRIGALVAEHLEACPDLLATVGAGPKTWPEKCGGAATRETEMGEGRLELVWTKDDEAMLAELQRRKQVWVSAKRERVYKMVDVFHYAGMSTEDLTNYLLEKAGAFAELFTDLAAVEKEKEKEAGR